MPPVADVLARWAGGADAALRSNCSDRSRTSADPSG